MVGIESPFFFFVCSQVYSDCLVNQPVNGSGPFSPHCHLFCSEGGPLSNDADGVT